MFEIEGVAGRGSGSLDALTRAVDDLLAADPRDVALGDLVADLATLHAQQQRLQAVFARMGSTTATAAITWPGTPQPTPCSPTPCGCLPARGRPS